MAVAMVQFKVKSDNHFGRRRCAGAEQRGVQVLSLYMLKLSRVLVALGVVMLSFDAHAAEPPASSADLLKAVEFSASVPLDEPYRQEFVGCDGAAGQSRKDHFLGFNLRL